MKIPGVVPLLVALAALALIFALLERVAGALPPKRLFRRERAVDFVYWFFTPWVSKTAAAIVVFLLIPGQARAPVLHSQPFVAQLLELLVLGDLLGYASHRLFHSRVLWKFHAIHHSAEDVDWLAATRLHPINEIGTRVMQVVPLYLLGFRGAPLAAAAPILAFYAIFLHANVRWDFGPLRYVIASPVFHRWHHTSQEEGRADVSPSASASPERSCRGRSSVNSPIRFAAAGALKRAAPPSPRPPQRMRLGIEDHVVEIECAGSVRRADTG